MVATRVHWLYIGGRREASRSRQHAGPAEDGRGGACGDGRGPAPHRAHRSAAVPGPPGQPPAVLVFHRPHHQGMPSPGPPASLKPALAFGAPLLCTLVYLQMFLPVITIVHCWDLHACVALDLSTQLAFSCVDCKCAKTKRRVNSLLAAVTGGENRNHAYQRKSAV